MEAVDTMTFLPLFRQLGSMNWSILIVNVKQECHLREREVFAFCILKFYLNFVLKHVLYYIYNVY